MFGHDGDLVAIHTEDLALQVDELSLTDFHIVPSLKIVLLLLPYTQSTCLLHSTGDASSQRIQYSRRT